MINHDKKKQEDQKRFFGNYRALVVDDVDVDDEGNVQKTGRVKVRVFSIHGDDVPDEALPWAIFSDPFMGGAADLGGFIVPDIGSHVWVFFEEGDHDFPVYFAGAPAKPHMPTEKDQESPVVYPRNKIFKTKAGFVIEIDDSENATRLRIKQPSGNEKISDHGGNVTEVVKGTLLETIEKAVTRQYNETLDETVEGNVYKTYNSALYIDVEGEVKIFSPNIQLGEDAAVEPSVLGDKLASWIENELKPWLDSHQHLSASPGSPSSAAQSAPTGPFDAGNGGSGGNVYSTKNKNQ